MAGTRLQGVIWGVAIVDVSKASMSSFGIEAYDDWGRAIT